MRRRYFFCAGQIRKRAGDPYYSLVRARRQAKAFRGALEKRPACRVNLKGCRILPVDARIWDASARNLSLPRGSHSPGDNSTGFGVRICIAQNRH